ncbi:hypothetical protein HZB60_07530 [candidate division KSB1 bacterium]|nr:hypothetical protein [candidate division KSB1 bacterium]
MDHEQRAYRLRIQQGGYVMMAVVVLGMVLLGTGLAFMRWSTDESNQSTHAAAAMQAYYLAQMGVIEKGFTWLRTQQAALLPNSDVVLQGQQVEGFGRYENVVVHPLTTTTDPGDFWSQDKAFRISSIGVATVPFFQNGEAEPKDVRRRAVLFVKIRNFADYMYLTDEEVTSFGDRIKFWHGDTLNGRVHSNSMIAIMQDPQFFDIVSTTEDDFWRGTGYNPYFAIPPFFNAPGVLIPDQAERLRQCAANNGYFYGTGFEQTIRAVFMGSSIRMYQWPTGTPFDSTNRWLVPIPGSTDIGIFCDCPLEVYGTLDGRVTIGTSFTMRLLDDIKYVGTTNQGIIPNGCDDYLGLVSEQDIKIANTPANGRENSAGLGNAQTNPALTDIVITAAIVALGESFTFENQNDVDSGYVCTCAPDDRGQIFVYGSVTQMRRGYVHRSTRQSTGYLKQYRYDRRLLSKRPPCFFDAVDNSGHALFDIVQWGQGVDDQVDINQRNYTRFN